MKVTSRWWLILIIVLWTPIQSLRAQSPRAHDVESIDAIIEAAYDVIGRAPGEQFDWDRFRSLFLSEARFIPNVEQTEGKLRILTVSEFIDWVESFTNVSDPNDRGIQEHGYFSKIERYGDVAHVLSAYKETYWGGTDVLTEGVNSFQLIWHAGRWWIASIAWDVTTEAGPVPSKYGGQ